MSRGKEDEALVPVAKAIAWELNKNGSKYVNDDAEGLWKQMHGEWQALYLQAARAAWQARSATANALGGTDEP